MRRSGWFIGMLFGVACGDSFAVDEGAGDATTASSSDTGSAATTAGSTSVAAGTGGAGSSSTASGAGGAGGEVPETSATANSAAGTGSSGTVSSSGSGSGADCESVTGAVAYGGHCYLDVTTGTTSAVAAEANCGALSASAGVDAYLVTIATLQELDFVVNTFAINYASQQDLWIGYTCDAIAHPNPNECGCAGPCPDVDAQTNANGSWEWVDGSDNQFVNWGIANPHGGGRCAALTKLSGAWAWADRDCLGASFLAGNLTLTYRTVCEWP